MIFCLLKENRNINLILISNRSIINKKVLNLKKNNLIEIPKWPIYFKFLPCSFFICLIFPLSSLFSYKRNIFWGPSFFIPLFGKFNSFLTIHDLVFKLFPYTQNIFAKHFGNKFIFLSMLKAKKILSVSNITSIKINEFYPNLKNKVSIISCGSDFVNLNKLDLNYKNWVFKFKKKNYILYVGSIEPRKNLISLLEAFQILSKTNKDLLLVIVAPKSWNSHEFFKRLNTSPVKEKIIILNLISDYDLYSLYSNSLCSILPSYYEGFGLTAIEALISGSSLICTTECELPFLVKDKVINNLSFFNPYKDNLSEVLKDHLSKKDLNLPYNEKSLNLPNWEKSAKKLYKFFIIEKNLLNKI